MIGYSIFKLCAKQCPYFTPPSTYKLCTLIDLDSSRNSMLFHHILLEAPLQCATTSSVLLQSLDQSLFCRPWKRGTVCLLATCRNHPLNTQHDRAQEHTQTGCKRGSIKHTHAQLNSYWDFRYIMIWYTIFFYLLYDLGDGAT